MRRVIGAIVALVQTIPGDPHITASSGSVSVNFESADDHAHAFAAVFGVELKWTGNDKNRWLSGTARDGELLIFIYRPMHPVVAVTPPDPDVVTAALALADEAVSRWPGRPR